MTRTAELFKGVVNETPEYIKKRVNWSFLISDKINNTLKKQGMTQKEFANLVGCSEAEVSRWVGGTHNFTLSTIARISESLGTSLIDVKR